MVLVKIDENSRDVIQELVDPAKVKQRLVDGLEKSAAVVGQARDRWTYHKDQVEVLYSPPFQGIFLLLEHRGRTVCCRGLVENLFLDKYVVDKTVHDMRTDGGVRFGP